MAPLPYNNTDIYTLEYNNGLDNHSLSVRYDSAQATLTDAINSVQQLFIALEAELYNEFVYVSARNQAAGQTFSLPAPIPSVAPTPAGGSIDEGRAPISFTFIGRSSGGRRNSLELYALNLPVPDSFLYVRGDSSVLDSGLDFLQGQGPPNPVVGTLISIDGLPTTWYDRVTVNYNDYWVRQARR